MKTTFSLLLAILLLSGSAGCDQKAHHVWVVDSHREPRDFDHFNEIGWTTNPAEQSDPLTNKSATAEEAGPSKPTRPLDTDSASTAQPKNNDDKQPSSIENLPDPVVTSPAVASPPPRQPYQIAPFPRACPAPQVQPLRGCQSYCPPGNP